MSNPAIANLSAEQKRALLEKLLRERLSDSDSFHPLSYGQQAWWFLYQFDKQSAACNVAFAARIRSEVDAAALTRSFQSLIDRHASLRTTYKLRDGKPVQIVHKRQDVSFNQWDSSSWSAEKLDECLIEEAQKPFDLENGPVMRVRLFTSSPQDHILLMVAHHIAVDLWSIVVLMHELRELYPAEKKGLKPSLQPVAVSYADYVSQQAEMLAGPEGARLWEFWQKNMAGELPSLNLPAARTRLPVQSHAGATFGMTLDEDLALKLKSFSQSQGVTLYVTLLAAFSTLLYRYSGQEDVIVGSLVAAGRSRAEFANLVGFLDNPIALRMNLSGNQLFTELVENVNNTIISALEHQDYPFALLVERLNLTRAANRAPLFQSMFILQRTQQGEEANLLSIARGEEGASMQLGDLLLESVDLQNRMFTGLAGQLDLTLTMAEADGRLSTAFQYKTDLFEESTIARMAEHFHVLLESITANPQQPLLDIPLLTRSEFNQLVYEWNDTVEDYPLDKCLHHLFEAQVERAPNAIASVFRQTTLTYQELNRRANRLARYLRSRGVGPEVVVGVCLERSQEMVIAVLAILKAGGAYLPLDPAYPSERLTFMLEDAKALLLLSQKHVSERFDGLKVDVICLDSFEEFDRESDQNLSRETIPENLAYLIYTSGSTGKPKGVMIDHRGAVNTIMDINQRFAVTADDHVLALSSLSFDLSVYDLFGTLAVGASIVIPEHATTPNPADWADQIISQRVTVWNSAPALMEMFVSYASGRTDLSIDSLRVVMLSGDWISVTLPDQIRAMVEGVEVFSLGGATEASIWSIVYPIGQVEPDWKSIPYGMPMHNQSFHVLNSRMNPAPIGVVGDLHIGGIGLAQGYFNRQELTAEKFVPDPFSDRAGARLYKTGDLGRYLPDGNIEFLGRKDHQVKIRGFRIELGEIETALSQYPTVRESVVITQSGAHNEKRLVAYIVPNQESASDFDTSESVERSLPTVWESIVEAGREQARQPLPEQASLNFPLLTEYLNRLAIAYIGQAFTSLGVFNRAGERHTADTLFHGLNIVPRYKKALRRWLETLADAALLRKDGEIYEGFISLPEGSAEALWDELNSRFAGVDIQETLDYFKHCGERLADVLTGRLHPAQLLFHEGASNVAESFYQQAFRHCNIITREVVQSIAQSLPHDRPLRLLEIGAGVGSTTAWLLPVLPAERTTYVFTDISKYFMDVGKANLADYPFVEYSLLVIETDPQGQGYEPNSFDVIIASSVLHATRSISDTLRNVRSLLAPRGLLLLVEETQFYPWFNVVGLQEGFDRFEDEQLRKHHPMLSASQWREELLARGFENFISFNEEPMQSNEFGISVIAAQASSAITRLTTEELRKFLRDKLPEYMIPSAFVMLDNLPLTPNGKVDRNALAAQSSSQPAQELVLIKPRNEIEEKLANLYAEVLGVERVGIDNNFFELGGDSLLATQFVSRFRKVFETELPLQTFFEEPTVRGLAERLKDESSLKQDRDSMSISPIARDGELALSFAQWRLWFLEQLTAGSPVYNVPAAVRLKGALDVAALEKSLNEIIRRHEALRTTFRSVEEQPSQLIAPTLEVSMPVEDLSMLSEAERESRVQPLITREAQQPFDIARGPLIRLLLLRLSENDHVLVVTMHHIISDGWSVGIIIREMAALYDAFRSGKPSPLSDLSIQYADFAYWQRQWLQEEVLQKQLDYWRKQLDGSTVLQLPTDHPRPAVQTFLGAKQSFLMPLDLLKELKDLSNRAGVTLFMTLLAGFKTLLYRYTGEQDVVVGSPIANRNHVEIEGLIGFFLNVLPLRTDMSGNPTFLNLLSRVREMSLEAYAHQDLPFDKLVEELQPERNLTHTPLFQVFFILQNAPLPPLELGDLTMALIEVDKGTSKFDLELNMFETQQGLLTTWIYSTDLFTISTIERMSRHFETLLRGIVAHPDAGLNQFEYMTEEEKPPQAARAKERGDSKLKKLMQAKPKIVNLSQQRFVETSYLDLDKKYPRVLSPKMDDIDLAEWINGNQTFVEQELLKHGAILFRGFKVKSVDEFEKVARVICPELFDEYGDLPREPVSGKVYTSTPYPADKPILQHNESSQMHCWPMKIWFHCIKAAERGGETPIADCRQIYELLDPEIRERFAEKRIMYVRNFNEVLDTGWQSFFRTNDKAVVEEYCRKAGIEYEWKDGNGLRTRKLSPAVAEHPKTGEKVFFNQIQAHHIACLDPVSRQSLLSLFKEEDLPRNVYYGDGSRIEDSVIQRLGEIYPRVSVNFPWEEGDVLMLDNMLSAHGRNAFVGSRNIVVAMGEMIKSEDVRF
jgi:amino acid adenylation domain-containing protein